MKPVTPLPWKTAQLDWRVIEGSDDLVIADVRSPNQLDAEYIAHACNAYPKLVALVQEWCDEYGHGGFVTLLEELGEPTE